MRRTTPCGKTRTEIGNEGDQMDYGKSGAAKAGKGAPKHQEHNAKGTTKNPYGAQADKAVLIARMKAAAEAKKKAEGDA